MNRGFLKRRIGTWINSLENKVCAPNDSEQKQDVGKTEIVSGSSTNNDENSSGTAAVTETIRKPCVSKLRSRFPKPKPNVKPSERKSTSSACVDKEKGVSIQSDKKDQKDEVPEVETLTSSSNTVVSISACTNSAGDVNKENDRTEAANPRSGWNSCEQELGTRTPKEDENITCNEKEHNDSDVDQTKIVTPNMPVDGPDGRTSGGTNQTTPLLEPVLPIRSRFPKCKPNLRISKRQLPSSSLSEDKRKERLDIQCAKECGDNIVDQSRAAVSNMPVDKPDHRISGSTSETNPAKPTNTTEGTNQQNPLPQPVFRSRFPRLKPNLKKSERKSDATPDIHCVKQQGISKNDVNDVQVEVVVLEDSSDVTDTTVDSTEDSVGALRIDSIASLPRVGSMIVPAALVNKEQVSEYGDEKLDSKTYLSKESQDHIQSKENREQNTNTHIDKRDGSASMESEASPGTSVSTKEGESSLGTTKCGKPEKKQSPIRRRSPFLRPKPNFRKCSSKMKADILKDTVDKQADVQTDRQHDVKNDQVKAVVPDDSASTVDLTARSSNDSELARFASEMRQLIRESLPCLEPVSTNCDRNLGIGISKATEIVPTQSDKEQSMSKKDNSSGECEASADASMSAMHRESPSDTIKCEEPQKEPRNTRMRSRFGRPKPNFRKCSSVLNTNHSEDSVVIRGGVQNDSSSGKKLASKNDSPDSDGLKSHPENKSLSGVNSHEKNVDSKDITKEMPEKSPDDELTSNVNCSNLDSGHTQNLVKAKDRTDKISAIDSDASDDTVLSAEDESSTRTAKSPDSQRKLGPVKIRPYLPKPKPNLKRISTTKKSSTSASKASSEKQGNICNDRQKSSRKESRSDSTDSDAVSPLKERNDSSSLSEVQSHKRKCVTKNNKECPEKRKARHKIHDQKAMTMLDLIYWNPRENPMVPPSSDKVQDSIEVDSPAADSAEGNADCSAEKQAEATKDREKDASANPVRGPQVIIGTNGEITIDESSLVVHRPVDTENLNTVTVSEDGSTTYSSFRTKPNARIWDDKETKKFYKALSTVGTDFTLMSELFTNRSRRELKLKYKREERYNRRLVDHALDSPPIYNLEMFRHDGDGKVGDTNKEGNAEKPKKTRKRRRKATGDQNVDVDSDVHQSPPKKKKRSQRRSRKKFLVSSSDEDTLPVELVPQSEVGESEKTNSYASADECQNEKDDGVGSTIIELIVCDDDIESARSSSKLIQDGTTLLDEKQQILSKATSETHYESEKITADKCEQSDLDASQNCVTETAQELIPQESLSEEKTVLLQKCLLSSNKSEDSLIAYAGNAMDDVASLPPVEVVETGVNKSVPSTKGQCPTELEKNLSDILLSPFVSESSSQEVPNPHKFLFLPRQGPSNEQVIHVFLVKDKDVSQQGKSDNSSCEKSNMCDASKTDENNPNKGFINVASESECCVTQWKSDTAHSSLNCSEDFTNQNAMP